MCAVRPCFGPQMDIHLLCRETRDHPRYAIRGGTVVVGALNLGVEEVAALAQQNGLTLTESPICPPII